MENEKPLVTTVFALTRFLKDFAVELGIGEGFAIVMSQVFVQSCKTLPHWSNFLLRNCAKCEYTPDSCLYLHPSEENCIEGSTPENIRFANVHMIESGRVTKCPVLSGIRDQSTNIPVDEGEPDAGSTDHPAEAGEPHTNPEG